MAEDLRTLPLLPLRGVVVFPYMMVNLDVGRDRSVAAIEAVLDTEERELVVAAQRDEEKDDPTAADLYDVGTLVTVRQAAKLPDGTMRVLVEGLERCRILGGTAREDYLEVETLICPDVEDKSQRAEALMHGIVDKFERWVKLTKKMPPEAMVSVAILDDAGRLADLIISHLNLRFSEKQHFLSCIDLQDRLVALYDQMTRELQLLRLEREIDKKATHKMEKTQKEYYLRTKIQTIREELGDDNSPDAVAEDYLKQLQDGDYPDEVQEAVTREVHRLQSASRQSADAEVSRTYIEWLLELPWRKSTQDVLNVTQAKKILDKEHYGLDKVKDRILDFLAVRQLAPDKKSPILCLVGPPGVGKTSLATSIAQAMGRKFVRASLGGVGDETELRGHRRTYVGSLPGRIITALRDAGVNNPVFLLDEIDKMGSSYRGDATSAMLEILDPEQNQTFRDHYLDVPFDLSQVLWVVTANNLGNIPGPLRDRMEIIELSSYTEYEKVEIAKRHLVRRQREQNGLKAADIRIAPGVFPVIIQEYTREAGVRELERLIGKLCRKAARRIVEGAEVPIRVTKKNLTDFLGKVKYLDTHADKQPEVGLVTGMAWTEVGGTILPVEATVLPGKGKLILTGQLGDVMQESAQAGMSYVRSRAKELQLPDDFYEKEDIHIHLPEGAIPKDGPSAGITMATCMISALTQRKVRSDVAMTGEITLRGTVLPIGGLKEKVLAAYREGMKTIILPEKNERDIEEIPAPVRAKLTFKPVKTMDEVLRIALI